jgi:hypothetical protein
MIRTELHSSGDFIGPWLKVVLLMFFMTAPAIAGVGLPPMPDRNDTNAMEQYRINLYYQAQKSHEERLKAGQERYDLMLTNRAHILQAMADELAQREQQVVIPTEAATRTSVANDQPNTWTGTIIGAGVIGLFLIGFKYHLSRQNA